MEIARLRVDPGSPHYDKADYPEHPYSAKAPYNETWIRVSEVTFDGKGGVAERGEPISWGTFGEYLDHAIESGCVDPGTVNELIEEFQRDGRAYLEAFEIARFEGPEAVESPAPGM